jgi:hypothetical protein
VRSARETERLTEAADLDRDLLNAFARGWRKPLTEDEFDALALRLFRHQSRFNPVAKGWWESAGASPGSASGWREVPPFPVSVYKRERVASFPPALGDAPRFVSSGTTAESRSRVYIEDARLYEAAIVPVFRRYCLPDRPCVRLFFLAPPPGDAPSSSLSHMFGVLRDTCGAAGSRFFGDLDFRGAVDPASVPGLDQLAAALARAESEAEPVFLLGPAFAFLHALDGLEARSLRFELALGSRIFQTGGFKGRSREASPDDLAQLYAKTLGIRSSMILHEYGMAELASQFYAANERWYEGPPWVRWQVLDPLTLKPVGAGRPGLLAVWDLANRSNCFALRTEDLAIDRGRAFELIGRAQGAEPRGCSLEADLLHASID